MTVGVGMQLNRSGVHGAVARAFTDRGPVTHVAPTCLVEAGTLVAGERATPLGDAAPSRVISDIVGDFDVDRVWFVDGHPYSPDEALEALLAETVGALVGPGDASAGAVTIGCPRDWDEPAQRRLAAIATRLCLPRPEIVPGLDAHEAAVHAALRRPIVDAGRAQEPTGGPLRVLRRLAPARPEPRQDDAVAPPVRRRLPSGALLVAALALVVGALVLAVRMRDTRGAPVDDRPSALTMPTTTSGSPITSAPPAVPALVIGLVTDGASEVAFRAALQRLNAAGGVLGNDVFPLVQPAVDLDAAMTAMSASAGAVVTDVVDDRLASLIAAAPGPGLAVCTTAAPVAEVPDDRAVVVGDVDRCVEFLALAAIEAGDSDRRRINGAVRTLHEGDGVACGSFARCRALLDAHQPIRYEPAAGRLVDARATTRAS